MKLEDYLKHRINRRQFLGSSAKNAAGVAAGMVGLAGAVAQAAPHERVSVAVLGVRAQGKSLAAGFAGLPDVDVAALCDVDEGLLPAASKEVEQLQGSAPRWERDFRRILDDPAIDAVVIATPDHWHAHQTILACQAGKDVYVETPVSHTVEEGRQMLAAARKHGRVVQAGLQQRSGTHFQSAIEFVRSGRLGAVHLAKAWTVHKRKPIGFKKDAPVPADVDYNLWLGPAPERPFNPNRFHHNWHWFWDYGSGELGNWGVHMLDIARWGLGVDLPARIAATGGKYCFHDDQQTPDTLAVQFAFQEAEGRGHEAGDRRQEAGGRGQESASADYALPGKTIIWEHRLWSNRGIEGRSAAAAFYGERGTLIVDRGGWKVYDLSEAITADASELNRTHYRNFIDCVKTRSLPAADLETGHISSALCHLGNIAYRLGREVTFTPPTQTCGPDPEANTLLTREYRSKWDLPTV